MDQGESSVIQRGGLPVGLAHQPATVLVDMPISIRLGYDSRSPFACHRLWSAWAKRPASWNRCTEVPEAFYLTATNQASLNDAGMLDPARRRENPGDPLINGGAHGGVTF